MGRGRWYYGNDSDGETTIDSDGDIDNSDGDYDNSDDGEEYFQTGWWRPVNLSFKSDYYLYFIRIVDLISLYRRGFAYSLTSFFKILNLVRNGRSDGGETGRDFGRRPGGKDGSGSGDQAQGGHQTLSLHRF